jgi:hypothetical protein
MERYLKANTVQWLYTTLGLHSDYRAALNLPTCGVRSFVGSTLTAVCAGPLASSGFGSAPTSGERM